MWKRRHIHHDEFLDFVQDVVAGGHLEGAALGIAKQVADRGLDSLTDKQRRVFDEHVLKPNVVDECSRCGGDIPWCEMYLAVHMYDDMCSWCSHMEAKESA